MAKDELDALNLYGGKEVVVGRINALLCEDLSDRTVRDVKRISEEWLDDENALLQYLSGRRELQHSETFTLSSVLPGGTIGDKVLVPLQFSSEVPNRREDWEAEMKRSPYVSAPHELTLEVYVKMRALEKFH